MNEKIMIVDDEEYIRYLYSEELGGEGCRVITVSNGFRLFEKIENEMPDLVVLDIRLRDYDGLDLLERIKNRFYHIPGCLCTAYDIYSEYIKSVAADFYVVKSLDLDELKTSTANTLNVYYKDSHDKSRIHLFARSCLLVYSK